jgi:Guanylate kinase
MGTLILIVGKSLSGKTHLQQTLEKEYGISPIKSRTTRPRRFVGEDSYLFRNREDYERDVDNALTVADRAYKVANGDTWFYWLTDDDFDFTGVKSLVIDPGAFKQIFSIFDNLNIIPVYIEPGFRVRMERYITQRSFEDENEVLRRVIADEEDFKEFCKDNMAKKMQFRRRSD